MKYAEIPKHSNPNSHVNILLTPKPRGDDEFTADSAIVTPPYTSTHLGKDTLFLFSSIAPRDNFYDDQFHSSSVNSYQKRTASNDPGYCTKLPCFLQESKPYPLQKHIYLW